MRGSVQTEGVSEPHGHSEGCSLLTFRNYTPTPARPPGGTDAFLSRPDVSVFRSQAILEGGYRLLQPKLGDDTMNLRLVSLIKRKFPMKSFMYLSIGEPEEDPQVLQ